MFYEYFNNTFPDDFGIPALNLPPITIYDRPRTDQRSSYSLYPILDAIYFASEKYVSTLTTHSYSTQLLLLTYYCPNPHHTMKKCSPYHGRVKIGYCSRKLDETICYKKTRFCCSTLSDKDNKLYYCPVFSRNNSERWICFMGHQHCTAIFQLIDVFSYLISFTLPIELVFVVVFFLFH